MPSRSLWILGFLVAGLGLAPACDLNPQPEVPEGNSGAAAGAGGAGGSTGGRGGSSQLDAGTGAGGSAGSPPLSACIPACRTGELCVEGTCVPDPCEPNICAPSEACKPNADFSAANCDSSCAGVVCQPTEECISGQCVATGCSVACGPGEVCLPAADSGFSCQADPCATDAGPNCGPNQICESATLSCVTDPCVGVKCPTGQACEDGECQLASDAG